MKSDQVKNILHAARTMSAAEARRVVAVLAKDAGPDEMEPFRDALKEDLKPLGEAIWKSYNAGDFAATVAGLKKVVAEMPDLVAADRLQALLAEKMTGWITEEGKP